jgi:hypothetical protein
VVLAYPRTTFVDGVGNLLDLHDPGWHLVSDDVSQRLGYAIGATHFVNAVLGVIRTDALQRTRLHASYPGGDLRLMAELSILGKFVEVPEPLYVRRIHAGSTGGNIGNVSWQRRYRSGARPAVRRRLPAAHERPGGHRRRCADSAQPKAGAALAQLGRETAYHWRRVIGEIVESVRRAP